MDATVLPSDTSDSHRMLMDDLKLTKTSATASIFTGEDELFAFRRTVSRLTAVEGKARVEEIARMLGGKTDSALAHARTLLKAK